MKKIILVSRCAWTLYNFRAGLIRHLKEEGFFVMGGGAGGDGFESKVQSLGIGFVHLPVDKKGLKPFADLKLFWAMYRWYRREKPDIVHHFTIKPVIYGSIAARCAGVPKIVNTITGLGFVFTPRNNRPGLRILVGGLYRFALKCADFTFFQNEDDLAFFTKRHWTKPKEAGLLPGSGVDIQFFSPSVNPGAFPDEKPLTFLMIARLLRHKGIYEFVEAARLVKESCPDVKFQVLGGPDERNPSVVDAMDLKRWKAEKYIHWLGETEDVRSFIALADVVVLPSYREGTPRSLLEAAAMGKPLIATDVTGCREVVEDGLNGILVPVQNVSALAQAMRRMIAEPALRQRMGVAGREKVVREFDESIVIRKITNIYSKERA